MDAQLDPGGDPVAIGDITIQTPGLSGTATTPDEPTRSGLRNAARTTTEFERALKANGMKTTHVVGLEITARGGAVRRGGRGRKQQKEGVILDVPAPAPGWEQVVLDIDELGVATWHFSTSTEPETESRRGGPGTRRYVLPAHDHGRQEPAAGEPHTRSLAGEIGKRIVKVIAFKVGKYVGAKARELLADWEAKNRPNGVRTFLPKEQALLKPYLRPDDPMWRKLGEGRALLVIHGTFSRIHSGLGRLPDDIVTRLQKLYNGRVIGLDHRTLSDDPNANAAWFLEQLPEGLRLDLDIVCHSRGGLVARTLAEAHGTNVKVHSVALVAVPSEGTILASVENWNKLLDIFSSVVNIAGGPGIGDIIETVLALVREIAVAGYPEIGGLACMVPGGEFLRRLNQPRQGLRYLAVASNFEPHDASLTALIKDEALDALHGGANDNLVRIDSATGADGPGHFPKVDKVIKLEGPGSVDHSAYFGQGAVMTQLADWLAEGIA